MCLIVFAYRPTADFPLVVIANRDEFYDRPTRDAHWWDDAQVLAGRDLQAGGTWLGVDVRGRFAAVTNVREGESRGPGKSSRGSLPLDYLTGNDEPEAYLGQVGHRAADFSGFNLVLGDAHGMWFYSNRDPGIRRIAPGVYGISNGGFDEPWPKLASGKLELEALLARGVDEGELMKILASEAIAEDRALPNTGVPLEIERMLSSRFIRSAAYGTRACSVVTMSSDGRVNFSEQNFRNAHERGDLVRESFRIRR